MQNPPEIKVHPLFPTLTEAQQNPELFNSDHLAIITVLPIDDKRENDIRMLSYNVTGAGAENNIVKTPEKEKIATARYQQIAHGLKLSAYNLQLDVIVLQEVTVDLMVTALKNNFDDSWGILPGDAEIAKQKPQQLTLYRKSCLELYSLKDWDARKKTLSAIFKVLNISMFLEVHNVWTEYNILPVETEKYYLKLLIDRKVLGYAHVDVVSVVLGDTNSRVAPVNDNSFKNLTTGIIPSLFNQHYHLPPEVQVPDHPDGGFYMHSSQNFLRQMHSQTVDITTGNIVEDNRKLNEVLVENSAKNILALWNLPRAILCLDDYYSNENIIKNKNIFQFEDHLQNIFSDPKIIVRMTSTIFNQKGIIVRFKNIKASSDEISMADLLADIAASPGITVSRLDSGTVYYPCLFIELNKVQLFTRAAELLAQLRVDDLLTDLTTAGMLPNALQFLSAASSGPDNFDQLAKNSMLKAQRDYGSGFEPKGAGKVTLGEAVGGVVVDLLTLGFLYDKRAATIKTRIEAAKLCYPASVETALCLLADNKTGNDLQSYKYLLASYLVNFKAESDEQAKLLIQLSKVVLTYLIEFAQDKQPSEIMSSSVPHGKS